MKHPFTFLCACLAGALSAATCTWTGGGDGSSWCDGDNWSTGLEPAASDDVVIDLASASVTVTNTTPVLNSLSIGASAVSTLVSTNWDTCIQATTVTVGPKGILTCGAAATNLNVLSRVYVKCVDLTIASGGKIDVNSKGYWREKGKPWGRGVGPGAGLPYSGETGGANGASHGGHGGTWRRGKTLPYDDPSAPELPGSSGGIGQWSNPGVVIAGGGAVRIDATGIVTVNGSILASSANSSNYGKTSANDGTAGSGGSIYITADAFKGLNGVLRADGGSSSCPTNFNSGRAGGGGCIAVKYNAASQQDGFVSGMTISAAPGRYKWKIGSKTYELGVCDDDKYRSEAGLGTLWFTDAKMLQSLGTGITGNILNISEYSADSLTVSDGHFRFGAEGFRLNISGNLTISGSGARLEIGGTTFTNRIWFADFYTATAPQMTIGGNLVVSNGGRLDIRAAATNGVDFVGATVNVGGAFTVGANGVVYCWSDSITGGSPRFEVGTFTVEEGGLVSADARGYSGGCLPDYNETGFFSTGKGPGYGKEYTTTYASGGGHGGRGGNVVKPYVANEGGHTYDSDYWPCMAGSGGAINWKYCYHAGSGGGVVDVRATGAVTVNGTISADGGLGEVNRVGAGSGGTIYLCGKKFAGGATAVLSACGGAANGGDYADKNGAGGGGRISVWAGDPYDSTIKPSRIVRSSEAPTLEKMSFLGTVTAAGGMPAAADTSARTYTPGDGTVWFSYVRPKPGMTMIVH